MHVEHHNHTSQSPSLKLYTDEGVIQTNADGDITGPGAIRLTTPETQPIAFPLGTPKAEQCEPHSQAHTLSTDHLIADIDATFKKMQSNLDQLKQDVDQLDSSPLPFPERSPDDDDDGPYAA